MTALKLLIQGYLVGMANIIPGVSGGTLALVLGIYPRLLAALGNIDMAALRAVLRAVTFRPGGWQDLQQSLRRLDSGFLTLLGIGAVVGVLSLSRLITFLLHQHFTGTYAFFFGLILVSIYFPFRLMKRRGGVQALVCLAAAVATVALTLSVDADKAMNKALHKASLQATQSASSETEAGMEADRGLASRLGVTLTRPSTTDALRVFGGAALAVAVMILPGVSGSFVMLLLGVYFDVLHAVNNRDLILMGIFMIGGVVGLLTLARVVSACLRRWFDATMAAMIGLMIGSLWGLWPFKSYAIIADELVILGNRCPAGIAEAAWAGLAFVVGVALIAGFAVLERRPLPKA